MDEDDIVIQKKVLNESTTNLLLGIRVRYMIDGLKALAMTPLKRFNNPMHVHVYETSFFSQ